MRPGGLACGGVVVVGEALGRLELLPGGRERKGRRFGGGRGDGRRWELEKFLVGEFAKKRGRGVRERLSIVDIENGRFCLGSRLKRGQNEALRSWMVKEVSHSTES